MNATKPRLLKRKSAKQRIRENAMALDYAKVAHQQVLRANMMVCALLAQHGGEMTLTQGTLDQCVTLIETIGYSIEERQPEGGAKEYVLRMTLGVETPLDQVVEPERQSFAEQAAQPIIRITV